MGKKDRCAITNIIDFIPHFLRPLFIGSPVGGGGQKWGKVGPGIHAVDLCVLISGSLENMQI